MPEEQQKEPGLSPGSAKEELVLQELRALYSANRYTDFKREFFRNSFFISKEKRARIKGVISKLDMSKDIGGPVQKPGVQTDLVKYAVDNLGWKLVDKP